MILEKKSIHEPSNSSSPTALNLLFRITICIALVAVVLFIILAQTPPELRRWFANLVRHFDGVVRGGIRTLKDEPELITLLHFGWFSLLYGFIHSAGPGHGKALVGAFFLRKKQAPAKAFLLAAVIASVHTLGAIILSFAFSTVLKGLGLFFRVRLQGYLIAASGVMIALIGLSMLFYKLFQHEKREKINSVLDNPFLLGAAAGIIPCPAAMVLMIFSIAHGIITLGIFSVLAMSLGMFLLLSLIGLLTVKGREGLLRLTGAGGIEKIGSALEYCSLFLIVLIGGLMTASIFA